MKRIVGMGVLLLFVGMVVGAGAAEKKTKKATAPAVKGVKDATTGMQFVWVPGGCYMMGDVFNNKNAGTNEKPVHEVCVDGFYMGKYEVTQSQWSEIMGSNPSKFFGENLPVEQVSWDDVQGFITKLNEKSGKQYRLPTEAEWEYAARSGGKKERWAGTSDEKQLGNYAWHDENSGSTTHPVGQKRPNGLGLYDMSGNVGEWCSDWYNRNTYDDDFIRDKPRNPQGASGGERRVNRGGSWYRHRDNARSSCRDNRSPDFRGSIGFRLVSP